MGKRSNRRIFRTRRHRAGMVLFVAMALLVLGGFTFLQAGPAEKPGEDPIDGMNSPSVAEAPAKAPDPEAMNEARQKKAAEARAERRAERKAERQAAREEAKKKREAEAKALEANPPDPSTDDLWMSIPALGLWDQYVTNTNDYSALDYGAIKLPPTAFPWQPGANTYIAAHRLGWPNTGSYHQFYNLPLLGMGDVIYLGDADGTTYVYKVSGFKEVAADDSSLTAPQAGRDMLSLQTCIEDYGDYWTMGPNWSVRYIVQADRVRVIPNAS